MEQVSLLIYSHFFYPLKGGMERNTAMLATLLSNHGFNVTVLTSTRLGKNEDELKKTSYNIIRGVKWYKLPLLVYHNQLVLINGGVAIPICVGSLICHKPYILIHQMAGAIKSQKRGLLQKCLGLLKFFLAKQARLNIGVSKLCISSKKLGNHVKTNVLYNPVDPALVFPLLSIGIEGRPYDLLFAGRVIEGKGVFVLADALKLLEREGIRCNVCIAGEGRDLRLLQSNLKDLTTIQVSFTGFVDGEELAKLYANSKCLVLPSTTHQEGSPLSMAEAFYYGTPVICSDQPVMLELISEGKCGISVNSGNAEKLKEAIKTFLMDEAMQCRLSLNAKERAADFSIDQYLLQMLNILNDVK